MAGHDPSGRYARSANARRGVYATSRAYAHHTVDSRSQAAHRRRTSATGSWTSGAKSAACGVRTCSSCFAGTNSWMRRNARFAGRGSRTRPESTTRVCR